MKRRALVVAFSAVACSLALGGDPPISRAAGTVDLGGRRTTSAAYTNDASIGGIAGLSTVASPVEVAKHGYIGQLYDLVALSVSAPPSTSLSETASRQLVAAPLADDSTLLAALDPATVSWSIVSGPIANISSSGLATAGNVYQDTAATVGGSAQSLSGQLGLTILNVNLDDYQSYAGDQIDDAWQVQYFGQPPNPMAGPQADPDGDGQNNRFEFVAGLVPTNAGSRFALRIQAVSGQPGQKQIVFSPRLTDRTYTPKFRPSLTSGNWTSLTGTTQSDNGNERAVIDLNATGPNKFYEIEIAKP